MLDRDPGHPSWMLAYEDEIEDLLRTYEQEVRERVAQAIEVQRTSEAPDTTYLAGWLQGMTDAAAITRGGGS